MFLFQKLGVRQTKVKKQSVSEPVAYNVYAKLAKSSSKCNFTLISSILILALVKKSLKLESKLFKIMAVILKIINKKNEERDKK